MTKVLVLYYSMYGNMYHMAQEVAKGVGEVSGARADVRTVPISGAERSLLAMLDALDRTRFTPVVAAPDGPLLREVAARGVRVEPVALPPLRRASFPRLLGNLRAGWARVRETVARVQPDIIHANGTPAMLYLLRARGVPVVWHVRDLAPLGVAGHLLYRRAARVAVISSAVREDLRRYAGNDDKCVLLPPAVDTARFCPCPDTAALRAQRGLPAGVPLLGMIAQFVPWKRHHLFLDTLELLGDRPWHAVLAGADLHHDEAYCQSLRDRLAEPPLRGRVTWLPWQDDAAPLLAVLDISVLTSEREPFGRVLIEAMACGMSVVAMDDAGPRDIVVPGETGILCRADAREIAGACARLLDNADRSN